MTAAQFSEHELAWARQRFASMGEDAEQDEVVARAVVETPLWKEMRLLLIGCYLDAFAIGWRGRQIDQGRKVAEILDAAGAGTDELDEALERISALLSDDLPSPGASDG